MSVVKSFAVGDGDMFYIRHNSDNFTIIDCSITLENRKEIVEELLQESAGVGIKRFISSHPDADHIGGLAYLDDEMSIVNFYCVKNEATKEDETDDFDRYCELRDSDKAFHLYKGCRRKWMNETSDERGSAGLTCAWPILDNQHFKDALEQAKNGGSPNNISPILRYSLQDGVKMVWMGDLETDFMEKVADDVTLAAAHILFAPHHGRESGRVPQSMLADLDPKIVIIGEAPSKNLNYYANYNTITQNSAGNIVFECSGGNVHIYVSSDSYSVDFLADHGKANTHGHYIGTLELG